MHKTGNWSTAEKEFMRQNAGKMKYEDIARYLNRKPDTVRTKLELYIIPEVNGETIENDPVHTIKKTLVWRELKQQFTTVELEKFMFYWRKIVEQFGGDVMATEEMQVVDYIRLELLGDRILNAQQTNLQTISFLEQEIEAEKKVHNIDRVDILMNQVESIRRGQESTMKEYKDIFTQKSKLLEQMKGTRDARIKHLSSTKENIPDWMKQIMMDDSTRKRMGVYMAKVRLAMLREEERLSQFWTYSDGVVDCPILTTKTFKEKHTEE